MSDGNEQIQLAEELRYIEKDITESQAKLSQFQSYIKMTNSLFYLIIPAALFIYIWNIWTTGLESGINYFDFRSLLILLWTSLVRRNIYGFNSLSYIGLLSVLLFIFRSASVSRSKYWYSKVTSMEKRKSEIKIEFEVKASYFERLVKINLDNLSEYYDLVQTHTDKSFEATRLASIMGGFLIFVGLIIGWHDFPNNSRITYISTGAGIIIEFISGVFFYLYNKTVTQLKEYHDSLLDVQNILLSFKIVEDMKEDQNRAQNIENMITYLVGKK